MIISVRVYKHGEKRDVFCFTTRHAAGVFKHRIDSITNWSAHIAILPTQTFNDSDVAFEVFEGVYINE